MEGHPMIAFGPPYHQEARVADPPVLRPPVESGEYTAHLFRTACDRMPIRRSMGGPPRRWTSGDRILALHLRAAPLELFATVAESPGPGLQSGSMTTTAKDAT